MIVSADFVRSRSFSGEFDSLGDGVIGVAVDEVSVLYEGAQALGVNTETRRLLIALHAAHILHLGLKEEAGGGDMPGPVKSETLARVGSRTFGSNAKLDGNGGIVNWQDSPYGRRHQSLWRSLPPALAFVNPK